MPKKIEFTVIVFFEDWQYQPAKYRTVTNVASIFKFCDKIHKVKSMNIYHKKTRYFMKQVKTLSDCYDFYNSLPSKYE